MAKFYFHRIDIFSEQLLQLVIQLSSQVIFFVSFTWNFSVLMCYANKLIRHVCDGDDVCVYVASVAFASD